MRVETIETSYLHVSDLELAERVEDGLPVAELVSFGRSAGFTAEELAGLVQIPVRTYARRVAEGARLSMPEGERAVRIMRLYDLARAVFAGPEEARRWLGQPLPALGGRSALDVARTEPGAREVERLLGRIEHGVWA